VATVRVEGLSTISGSVHRAIMTDRGTCLTSNSTVQECCPVEGIFEFTCCADEVCAPPAPGSLCECKERFCMDFDVAAGQTLEFTVEVVSTPV
jgi:hypothetical protein